LSSSFDWSWLQGKRWPETGKPFDSSELGWPAMAATGLRRRWWPRLSLSFRRIDDSRPSLDQRPRKEDTPSSWLFTKETLEFFKV
jgi:hypothetical protein